MCASCTSRSWQGLSLIPTQVTAVGLHSVPSDPADLFPTKPNHVQLKIILEGCICICKFPGSAGST
jgi:hypothetical protein